MMKMDMVVLFTDHPGKGQKVVEAAKEDGKFEDSKCRSTGGAEECVADVVCAALLDAD